MGLFLNVPKWYPLFEECPSESRQMIAPMSLKTQQQIRART